MLELTEQELDFAWSGLTLAGVLHLPSGESPHPAVLMLQGSGAADRDCGGYFVRIRQAFLARQIATFAFDKPGCGASAGDRRNYGLEGRADQATAALEALRGHSAVDAERVGIWGQSQGGWLVQLLASRLPDLSFAIANSGPSINVQEQDLYGCEHTMRSQGHPEHTIEESLAFVREVHEAAERGTDYATVNTRILRQARDKPWYASYLTIDDAEDWHHFRLMVEDQYEPRDALTQIRCPFLAIYGGLDLLVPAWKSAEESGCALQRAETTDASVVIFPDGDHRIQDPRTGEFVAGYLDHLGDWTAQRA